jgi:hypothetical protein
MNQNKEERPVDADAWGVVAAGWLPKVEPMGTDKFYASLPFRQVFFEGATADDALACLVRGYCELSRNGSFNPGNPDARGVPMLQHVLEILQEELNSRLQLRRGCVLPERKEDDTPANEPVYDDTTSKRSDVIAGLATAIAALARVKAL